MNASKSFYLLVIAFVISWNCSSNDQQKTSSNESLSLNKKEEIKIAFNKWRSALLSLDFDCLMNYVPKKDMTSAMRMARTIKKQVINAKKKSKKIKKSKELKDLEKSLNDVHLTIEEVEKIDASELAKKLGYEMLKKMASNEKMKIMLTRFKDAKIKTIEFNNKEKTSAIINFETTNNTLNEIRVILEDWKWKFPNN